MTEQNLVSVFFFSTVRSINYEIEQKQSKFEKNAKQILRSERLLLKIGNMEKNCLLISLMYSFSTFPLFVINNRNKNFSVVLAVFEFTTCVSRARNYVI